MCTCMHMLRSVVGYWIIDALSPGDNEKEKERDREGEIETGRRKDRQNGTAAPVFTPS